MGRRRAEGQGGRTSPSSVLPHSDGDDEENRSGDLDEHRRDRESADDLFFERQVDLRSILQDREEGREETVPEIDWAKERLGREFSLVEEGRGMREDGIRRWGEGRRGGKDKHICDPLECRMRRGGGVRWWQG
jgi:hypothetical protein